MGYNLYITRRRRHFDDVGPSITEEEWRTLVKNDPELEFKDPRVPLKATWNGKAECPEPWFDYSARNGAIDTKNPDTPVIAKMLEIAKRLNAKVQGDDCEVYLTPTEHYFEAD